MEKYICENLPRLVNACGLIFDIIGVLLLWKFGLPESINRSGEITMCFGGTDENAIAKAAKYDKYAKVALVFIIGGFTLQFISNFI